MKKKERYVILKTSYIPWVGNKRRKKKKEIYMYILPRSTRRISLLLIDDELAAFAGAFGAAEVVDEDIFVWKRNAI